MTFCDAEADCRRSDQEILDADAEHSFAGYGYMLLYHPECCPGAFDGSRCFQDADGHPEGWRPRSEPDYEAAGPEPSRYVRLETSYPYLWPTVSLVPGDPVVRGDERIGTVLWHRAGIVTMDLLADHPETARLRRMHVVREVWALAP